MHIDEEKLTMIGWISIFRRPIAELLTGRARDGSKGMCAGRVGYPGIPWGPSMFSPSAAHGH